MVFVSKILNWVVVSIPKIYSFLDEVLTVHCLALVLLLCHIFRGFVVLCIESILFSYLL